MAKITYQGPAESVYLAEERVVVEQGQEVDLPAEVVNQLVLTGEWSKTGKKPAGEKE
jgi:hypothetical protein